MVAFDARGGGLQGGADVFGQALEGGFEFALAQGEVGDAVRGCAVEAVGVFDQGCVTTAADVVADVGNDAFGFGVLRGFEGEQFVQFAAEVWRGGGEFFHGAFRGM